MGKVLDHCRYNDDHTSSDSQRGAYAPLGGNSIIMGGNMKNIVISPFYLFYPVWVKIINV